MIRENTVEELRAKTDFSRFSPVPPVAVAISRTFLLAAFGTVFFFILSGTGNPDPRLETTRWWTFQLIGTNVVLFFLLNYLFGREKIRYFDVIRPEPEMLWKDALLILTMLVPSVLVAYFGMLAPQLLLYSRENPPDVFYRPLPLWAAALGLFLFPLSNALVETTVYFGYALQRIEACGRKGLPSVLIVSLFLALQHIAFPLYPDARFLLWRFLSFVPFALFAGFVYAKTRRLFPLVVVHFLGDLSQIIPIFVVSLNP